MESLRHENKANDIKNDNVKAHQKVFKHVGKELDVPDTACKFKCNVKREISVNITGHNQTLTLSSLLYSHKGSFQKRPLSKLY